MAETVYTASFGLMGLRLLNEEFLRPFGFGNNWKRLRVSMRVAVPVSGGSWNFSFGLGVCSGTVGYMAPNTTDWFGHYITNAEAGANNNTFSGGVGSARRKIGANTFDQNDSGSTALSIQYTTNSGPGTMGFEVSRSQQTNSMSAYYWSRVYASADYPCSRLEQLLNGDCSYNAIYGSGSYRTSALTLSGQYSDYYDTLSIVWPNNANYFHIYTITVVRMA